MFAVVYDANVLYPSSLRDLLIRVGQAGLVQPKWTPHILDETFRSLKENRPDLDPAKRHRTRELMISAVRDCLVKDYELLVGAVTLPDPDDRHVLAAAIKAHAHVIVTKNLQDFPASTLTTWGIEATHPDAFILDQIHLDKATVYGSIQRIADSCRNQPCSPRDILARLESEGLVESVAALRTERI